MSKAKLYKVKLVQGFNAKGRNRAGITLQKNATLITELSKEQLEALENDVWIEVSDAPEGAEPTAPGDSFSDAVVPPEEEDQTPPPAPEPYEGVSFKDLKAEATEKGLDIKGLKSRADVIAVLTAEPTADDEEEIEISEDMSREDLEKIATDLNVETPSDTDKYPNNASLVAAIKEASESEES
jgi:hypothetical protein